MLVLLHLDRSGDGLILHAGVPLRLDDEDAICRREVQAMCVLRMSFRGIYERHMVFERRIVNPARGASTRDRDEYGLFWVVGEFVQDILLADCRAVVVYPSIQYEFPLDVSLHKIQCMSPA